MVIYFAGEIEEEVRLDEMTPRQIVAELDKHVVGQNAMPSARWRSRCAIECGARSSAGMAVDVMPKNIIMIGSTGVGKTEIARRLARMSNSPFLKVEASKFTEVGYVGRDVESMIRDLTEIAVEMTRQEKSRRDCRKGRAERRGANPRHPAAATAICFRQSSIRFRLGTRLPRRCSFRTTEPKDENFQRTREKLRTQLRSGKLDNRLVEIEVREKNFPMIELAGPQGIEEMGINMKDMLGNHVPGTNQATQDAR